MKGKAKFHLAKIIRAGVAFSLLVLLIIISIYFITHWRKEEVVPRETKEISQQKIERTEEIQHLEFKGDQGRIQIKAQKHYMGEDENYYLEGKVEILEYGKKGEQRVSIWGDKVVYDKDLNHFVLQGQGKVNYKNIFFESNYLEYNKKEEVLSSDKGVKFSSRNFKGSSQKISYFLNQERLTLEGNIEVEMMPGSRESPPLLVKGNSFTYIRQERKGNVEGNVQLFYGKNHSSSDFLSFELFEDEEHISLLSLKGAVKAYFLEEEKKTPSPEQGSFFSQTHERRLEAEEITFRAFLNLPKVHSVEARGNCSLKLIFYSGRISSLQAESMDFIFNLKRELRDFKATQKVRMFDKEEETGEERLLEGEEMSLEIRRNVLWVIGKANSPSRLISKNMEIAAQGIALFFKYGDLEAREQVKVVLKSEGGQRELMGFFSNDKPVFATAQEMRYWKEKKRFTFSGKTRIWQEKEMLLANEVIIFEESGEILCAGEVGSIIFHRPREGEKEEKIEISGERMSFEPQKRLVAYEENSSLRIKNINLSSQSLSVYLDAEKGKMKMIVAKGNVVIAQDLQEGQGEEARYNVTEETIELLGNPVFIDKDRGKIEGDKLTFYMGDGRIVVENKERKRSEIIIKT